VTQQVAVRAPAVHPRAERGLLILWGLIEHVFEKSIELICNFAVEGLRLLVRQFTLGVVVLNPASI
jgi:hypothetical protein